MATWTYLLASAITGSTIRHVCSSGVKIYYVDNTTEDVYEYDPGTNTETLIIDASAITNYGNTLSIAWFKGDLYAFNYYSTVDEFRVERWDGTPNDLTTVKTFAKNDFGPTQLGMLTDGNTLVAFGVENPSSPAAYSAECWYSSDGSGWSAGSWNVSVWSPPDLNGTFLAPRNTDFPTGLYREFVTDINHPTRSITAEKSIFLFSGGVWTKIAVLNTNANEIYNFSSPNEDVHWTYTTGQYYDSAFAGTTTIGSSPRQTYQVNMPYSVAISLAFSPAPSLYQYSAGAWVLLDTMDASWDLDSNAKAMILMDNGDPYIIAYSSIGGGYDVRIFGRDTPINPPATAAFYYGRNGLRRRSELPFPFLNIGGLSISYPFAVLGAGVSGSPMVAFATPNDDYGSFVDFTGSLGTDPIRSFDSTPYGNSQAASESGEDAGPGGHLSGGKC